MLSSNMMHIKQQLNLYNHDTNDIMHLILRVLLFPYTCVEILGVGIYYHWMITRTHANSPSLT